MMNPDEIESIHFVCTRSHSSRVTRRRMLLPKVDGNDA
jgi:hypothetical protein